MPSLADNFVEDLDTFKEFVDDEGRHFYVIQFEDESGRILSKKPSDDGNSIAEFVIRDGFAMEAMRLIASGTDFEIDEGMNTQQNLRNLMS